MTNSLLGALFTSILALSASSALADSVSGGVVGKDKQFRPTHVVAFQNGGGTTVILTAEAVDSANIIKTSTNKLDFEFAYMNDPATLHKDNIVLGVDAKNVVSMNATLDGMQNVDSSGVIYGTQGMLSASCATNTKERVACHVTRPENPNAGAKKWVLDVTFDSAVLQLAAH